MVPAEILDQQTETELPHIVLNQETPDEKVTDSDAKEKEEQTGTQTETKTKTEVNATETAEQIIYNTGSFNVHVVSEEDFENDLGDACFEEDGSYTTVSYTHLDVYKRQDTEAEDVLKYLIRNVMEMGEKDNISGVLVRIA